MQRYGRKKLRGNPNHHPRIDAEARCDMTGRARREERELLIGIQRETLEDDNERHMATTFYMHPRDNPVGFRSCISVLPPDRQDHLAMARCKIAICGDPDDVRTELAKLALPEPVDDFIQRFRDERRQGRWLDSYSDVLTFRECQAAFLFPSK